MVYRSRIISSILLATVALLPVSSLAADMDGVVYADDANFVQSAELGSGWYLRGDISYNLSLGQERGFSYDANRGIPSLEFEIGDSIGWGVGFGKQINSLLRADITIDRPVWSSETARNSRGFTGRRTFDYRYLDGAGIDTEDTATVYISRDAAGNFVYSNDCGGGAGGAECSLVAAGNSGFAIGGSEVVEVEKSVWSVLANGYVDLPKFQKFTPYIGGGVGMARPVVNVVHKVNCITTENEACGFPAGGFDQDIEEYELINDAYAKWLPTFAVAAGVSYDITDNIKFDLGYKYAHIMDVNSVLAGSNLDPDMLNDVENIHSVKLGLRVTAF